ncbi:MAG: hypothetical protein GY866_17840 [Proteobacteria bacterium]|nr:hypothetical protein [Pseudomonadota bacterium]
MTKSAEDDFVFRMEKAFGAVKPLPLISQEIEGITRDRAYEIQDMLNAHRREKGGRIVGFKAGMTAVMVDVETAFKNAVSGILFETMICSSSKIALNDFMAMMIETEIGYRFGTEITRPVGDVEDLKTMVSEVFPAIEMPDFAFSGASRPEDLVAADVVARKVLLGQVVEETDTNAVSVTLYHEGQAVNSGTGNNALGDQWKSLQWLVNHRLERGDRIEKGQIAITGALGSIVAAQPGQYLADYGRFGKIEFECE